jgi:hypothetical protein
MISLKVNRFLLLSFILLFCLTACDSPTESTDNSVGEATAMNNDAAVKTRVERAITSASDLPQGISIDVNAGVVSVSGSLSCEDCGGLRTPGNIGTIQETLGAVVRAVPGVDSVQFSLAY